MATNIAIPKLGLTMTEAAIVEWLAKEGEWLEAHKPALSIETEKTTYEIETQTAGFLHIVAPAGSTVAVGGMVGVLAQSREEYETICSRATISVGETDQIVTSATVETQRLKATPAARALAQQRGIDISKVVGTGPEGRITREDVERALEEKTKQAPVTTGSTTSTLTKEEEAGFKRARKVIPLTGMRKAIAQHMHRSLQASAQMTRWGELDIGETVKFREALLREEKALGVRIGYTAIFIKAVVGALKVHPLMNSSVVGEEIRVWENMNIGVAVALEELEADPDRIVPSGLIVPVIHDADKKSLVEIHRTVEDVAEKARRRELLPDEVAGGTFTVTNLGASVSGEWVGFGTPILNQPEVGIMEFGTIVEKPVVRGGQIVVRPVVAYSLTTDHRVIDGVPAARFIDTLGKLLGNPSLLRD